MTQAQCPPCGSSCKVCYLSCEHRFSESSCPRTWTMALSKRTAGHVVSPRYSVLRLGSIYYSRERAHTSDLRHPIQLPDRSESKSIILRVPGKLIDILFATPKRSRWTTSGGDRFSAFLYRCPFITVRVQHKAKMVHVRLSLHPILSSDTNEVTQHPLGAP